MSTTPETLELSDDSLVFPGTEIKALPDGRVGGYLVLFSSADDPDLEGDFFTASTDFDLSEPAKSAVYYAHGLDPTIGRRKLNDGQLKADDFGVWCETQLNLRDKYEKYLYELAEKGKLGWSSGTAPHLVERQKVAGKNGPAHFVKRWPLGLDASITPTPCEHRTCVVSLKSLDAAGLLLDGITDEPSDDWMEVLVGNLEDDELEETKAQDLHSNYAAVHLGAAREHAKFSGADHATATHKAAKVEVRHLNKFPDPVAAIREAATFHQTESSKHSIQSMYHGGRVLHYLGKGDDVGAKRSQERQKYWLGQAHRERHHAHAMHHLMYSGEKAADAVHKLAVSGSKKSIELEDSDPASINDKGASSPELPIGSLKTSFEFCLLNVETIVERLKGISELRTSQDRKPLGPDNLERCRVLKSAVDQLLETTEQHTAVEDQQAKEHARKSAVRQAAIESSKENLDFKLDLEFNW